MRILLLNFQLFTVRSVAEFKNPFSYFVVSSKSSLVFLTFCMYIPYKAALSCTPSKALFTIKALRANSVIGVVGE